MMQIKQRFGSGSSERREIFEGLHALVEALKTQSRGVVQLLVDGSFVTDKTAPHDADCILVVNGNFDFASAVAKQLRHARELFHAHLFTFLEEDNRRYRELLIFFGHDRDGMPKGLLEVKL
ncbi:MAG: hypothetical protein NC924_04610 [Candidatus Omnitrophica bacterium]|nr:hypothetical protein [Candidatus Omnitrophota bacterium]